MPLVIAVLVIIVIVLNVRDGNKRAGRQASLYARDGRKTNAALEQKIMDTYMKQGLSADEAFQRSYEDMISLGYEPCIPREAYGKNSSICVMKHRFNPRDFDSWLVRDRRADITKEWAREHPGENAVEHEEEIERLVYQNFPTSQGAYIRDVKRRANRAKAVPVGQFIIYPGLGTCEVIAHNWIKDGLFGGTYTLKVLKTGQIVTFVQIGDSKIQRQ